MTLDVEVISEESANVDELRIRFKGKIEPELYEDDNLFHRFLRARNQNLDAAETMLKKHLQFRRNNKINTVLTDYIPPEVLQKYTSLDIVGYDYDGTPILYSYFGNMDTRGITKSCTMNDLRIYVAWRLEVFVDAMKKQTKKLGKLVDKLILVINFDNFSLASATHKPTIEALINLVQMYDANFPERLKACYCINASMYFTLAWSLIKPFFAGPTFQKIRIYGKDDWQNVILSELNNEAIPGFLGGKLTDPDGDPMCKTIVRFAGPIPESYYRKSNESESLITDAKKLLVNRMSKAEVRVEVEEGGSNITWEFEIKSRDILFSLVKKDKKGEEGKEVVEKTKVETSVFPESGVFQCSTAGTYFLTFDNSYSWMHGKEIHYAVSVVKPVC